MTEPSASAVPPGLCRDCLTAVRGPASRCPDCGSPRLARHAELDRLPIAHVDCDAFYASIEKRDDPSLADKPVIVGGARRGVVATCCYIARIRGVRSAMPMFKALEACPDAVVIRPNMAKYVAVGREIREMMRALTPEVEPVSIDEAFLDLSGTERVHKASPAKTLARFALAVESRIGVTVSIGLSFNKFLAKLASDLDKPRGFSVVGEAEAVAFLAPLPVGRIWGVGAAMQKRLAADGIRTIGAVQRVDEAELVRRYGSMGIRFARLSHARDDRKVEFGGEAKSVSSETTFDVDISDPRELAIRLRRLSERVATRMKKAGLAGRTVTLKLKTADFRIRSRAHRLADPTQLADRIFRAGLELLESEADGTRFRLIGIGLSDLGDPADADPADLVDDGSARRAAAERAVDRIREKFGDEAVRLGLLFDGPATTGKARDRTESASSDGRSPKNRRSRA